MAARWIFIWSLSQKVPSCIDSGINKKHNYGQSRKQTYGKRYESKRERLPYDNNQCPVDNIDRCSRDDSGVDITEERKKTFNFSDGYYNNELSLVVKEGDTTITAVEDLQGKKVGTELGTTADTYADSLNSITNVKYNSGAVAVMNLKAGKVDAVILDKPVAQQVLLTNDGCQILEGVKLVSSETGIVVNKNNPELLKEINAVIKELKETGKLQELIAKYFSTEKAVETTDTATTDEAENTDTAEGTEETEEADETEETTAQPVKVENTTDNK